MMPLELCHCMKILEIVQETFGNLQHLDNTSQLLSSEIADNLDFLSWVPEYFDRYFDEADDIVDLTEDINSSQVHTMHV